ncbi:hypothetical protein EYR40_005007 [Pleurotus pulmonarius]|nr:hypothetical protein EYR36_006615 [Pleurotus pulmonarius]KAF4601311.1 hypothetical protein EYR38_005963 [Pleurotus pulmonarius]KAF4601807.1 hypothetical protein EYR40_005007 [Pleurotus pulmonarius]
MARTHERSPSPEHGDALIKRLKTTHVSQIATRDSDPTGCFATDVLDHTNIQRLHKEYSASEPFKHALVEKLFQDDLLKKVKDECLSELSFTEKETDIYKVNQTGDLASLNYLSAEQISLLPNLLELRDALYSPTFRTFLRTVTGCGPLSGTKQDMSVNSYTKGCHLLNHDDVIGTRRVSYILYMPLPHYQFWQKDWGGALELYPAKVGPDGNMEPEAIPAKSVPPSWNQFIFFEVQPGRSFHSVEEVVVGGDSEDGRVRLSISGWFHAAQEGEEGYVPESASDTKSSREQLTSTSTVFKSYPDTVPPPISESTLSVEYVSFLSEFLNPVYLQPRTMNTLANRFVEESSLELHHFLAHDLATTLEPKLRELDDKDGLGASRGGRIPPHTAGTNLQPPPPSTSASASPSPAPTSSWQLNGPPHKWRYCTLRQRDGPVEVVSPRAALTSSDEIMRSLQDELFASPAFRAWLAIVSRLLPLRYSVEARRFRPGLDYRLATSEENEARLDVSLGLTPDVQDVEDDHIGTRDGVRGWQAAEWGGWECYMAPHDEEDDPAVYRASTHKKKDHKGEASTVTSKPTKGDDVKKSTNGAADSHPKTNGSNGSNGSNGHTVPSHRPSASPPPVGEQDDPMSGDEEEEESTLLTVQPGFNRLLLVLRDERVMRFVKYVSAAAEGSRWDVCGEYEVGMIQEEDEE